MEKPSYVKHGKEHYAEMEDGARVTAGSKVMFVQAGRRYDNAELVHMSLSVCQVRWGERPNEFSTVPWEKIRLMETPHG